jgi:hypothetical protein
VSPDKSSSARITAKTRIFPAFRAKDGDANARWPQGLHYVYVIKCSNEYL